MLEPEQEYMLAKRWVEDQDTDAAHQLVTSHLRLAAKIAMGYRGYGLPQAEVISEANVGLMQAVKRFDPEKGFRLATYAMWWIRASIQEYILRSWSLVKLGTTSAQKKLFFNLRKAKAQDRRAGGGRSAPENVEQIANDLGVTEDEVISMNRRLSGGDASLNATIGTDGDRRSGRTGWRTRTPTRPSAYERRARRDGGPARAADRGDGRAERPREGHPDPAPPARTAPVTLESCRRSTTSAASASARSRCAPSRSCRSVSCAITYGLSDPANVRLDADLAGGALRDVGVYPIGAFRLATGLEPEVTGAEAIWENGVDTSAWMWARAGDVRFSCHVSMRTTRRQEMVFEGDDGWLAVTAPFNPGPYAEAALHLHKPGEPIRVERFPDFRQYEAQVEAVAVSLLDGAAFAMPLEASRGTQAVLDAVFDRLSPAR
jgi:alternative sigma factor RpoH